MEDISTMPTNGTIASLSPAERTLQRRRRRELRRLQNRLEHLLDYARHVLDATDALEPELGPMFRPVLAELRNAAERLHAAITTSWAVRS
jgi:hypothetical protein